MDVKICGITQLEDALLAESLGAKYIGMIFAKQSPRCISLAQAKLISDALTTAIPVGVFVEQDSDIITEIASQTGIKVAQVYQPHGDLATVSIWEVLLSEQGFDQQRMQSSTADKFVLEASHKGEFGGKGLQFDWELLPEQRSNIVLSGGIGLDNIEQAMRQNTAVIDICSGVESAPGIKDQDKLKQLFTKVNDYVN